MQKLFRVTVDISKKIPAPAFEVNTNDLKSVKLEITITNGQSLLDLTDVTPRINIRKPDNEVIFQDCEIVDATAGKVEIILENQAYLVPGTHTAEIACYKGNEITAITGTFSYKSIKGIMNDAAVESKSEFTAINRTLNEAERILEDLRENGGGAGVDQQARQKIEEVTTRLADTTSQFKSALENESVNLGVELARSTGWTVPTGWTGTFANGFKNTVGNANPLTFTMPEATGTKTYLVSFRVESPTPSGVPNASTDFTVSLGNSEPFITYRGGGNYNYSFGIQSVRDGNLVFNPGATFDGTIKNVSVKEITGQTNPTTKIKDSSDKNSIEIRPTKADLRNTFIGNSVGKNNFNGDTNTVIGNGSFEDNTSGYWNTAVGTDALKHNRVGSRNIAIGHLALEYNISGDRNVAIGTFAIERNTSGRQNIGIGADALFENTTGSRNIAIGMGALGTNNADQNIAIGYSALSGMVNQSDSIAIGTEALKSATAAFGIAIGKWAGRKATTADNTIIGFDALSNTTTGNANTVIGKNGMRGNLTGVNNVAIGQSAMQGTNGNYSVSRCTVIGAFAGWGMKDGADNNTLIGMESGNQITTGANNIMIGRQANPTGATASNQMNIGNTLYGNILNKRIGVGVPLPEAKLHVMAGTETEAPLRFDVGVLRTTPMNGTMEYDGTNLYFTVGGVRKTVQLV